VQSALSERTRLVAITYASNAVGTIPDVATITRMAHAVGALVFVDAVQYAPLGPIDVQALACDFLVCSAYKFFGPHVGILYGKAEHLRSLTPHKVRPARDTIPYRWETGTLNHEGIAGVTGAVCYLYRIGQQFGHAYHDAYACRGFTGMRLTLKTAMRAIHEYEKELTMRLLDGLEAFDDLTLYGLSDRARLEERGATVAFTWSRLSAPDTAIFLATRGICCWSGNYYAVRLMERLGLDSGGAVRIGLAHYNTAAEIDTLLQVLAEAPSTI
jgi:selenocysteine lyase/cysteine desulfurase